MALALRLFLLLLLAVALPARAAQAAPLQVRGADWDHNLHDLDALLDDSLKMLENAGDNPVAESDLASQPISITEPLGDAEGVSARRTFPAPLVDVARKPSSHRRGPLAGKNKTTGHKKPHGPSEHMRQMLAEMEQAGQEMEGEAVLKAAFPRGSSDSVPASAAGREAMPGTVTGAEPVAEGGAASQPIPSTDPLGDAEGRSRPFPLGELPAQSPKLGQGGIAAGARTEPRVSAGRTFPGPLVDVARKPSSHRRGPLRRKNKPIGRSKTLEESKNLEEIRSDVERRRDAASTSTHANRTWKNMRRVFCWGTPCLVKLMAIVAGAAVCLMICSAGIWYSWKRKWHHLVEKLNACDWFQDLYSWRSNSSSLDSY
ncbi:uncharacterized protein LOC128793907 isoform X2 [Vidua chalybeata]|uniref:uncharacterized protein LOC128793907 isoform X2 n=1 Tax=Vidua chalybeata TaxID=81927 RepID=UPI0023A7E173|nr:uncharacterized protein LOC128793907 isoform X2 [Vidua chalybeata]